MEHGRRHYTREQALRWRERWSESDRRVVSTNVDRLLITRFEEVPSGAYLHGKDDAGVSRMYVNPGFLEFLQGSAPPEAIVPPEGLPYVLLSTFQERTPGGAAAGQKDAFCPAHPGVALPASGRCDDCS